MSHKVSVLSNNESFDIELSEFSLEFQEFFLKYGSVQLTLFDDNKVLVEPMPIYESQE
ncbi:MAG: hypothetical protein Q4B88_02245 [Moraxella sp.]|nr:hypothetical protein [Moraxella sp.]